MYKRCKCTKGVNVQKCKCTKVKKYIKIEIFIIKYRL